MAQQRETHAPIATALDQLDPMDMPFHRPLRMAFGEASAHGIEVPAQPCRIGAQLWTGPLLNRLQPLLQVIAAAAADHPTERLHLFVDGWERSVFREEQGQVVMLPGREALGIFANQDGGLMRGQSGWWGSPRRVGGRRRNGREGVVGSSLFA